MGRIERRSRPISGMGGHLRIKKLSLELSDDDTLNPATADGLAGQITFELPDESGGGSGR